MNDTASHSEQSQAAEKKKSGSGGWLRLLLLALAIIGLFVLARVFNLADYLEEAMDWIEGQGVIGYLVFVLLYIVSAVFFVPGSVLTIGAGVVWGLWKGFILVSVGSTLGATAAFLVGRYLARDWVAKKIEGNPKFEAIDNAVAREGWKIVGLTRLSPVFPFTLLNYAYGLTKVSLPHYFFATWAGMAPGTIMYVYIGFAAGTFAAGGTSTQNWILYGIGFVATVAVTVLITRIARRALGEKVDEEALDAEDGGDTPGSHADQSPASAQGDA